MPRQSQRSALKVLKDKTYTKLPANMIGGIIGLKCIEISRFLIKANGFLFNNLILQQIIVIIESKRGQV